MEDQTAVRPAAVGRRPDRGTATIPGGDDPGPPRRPVPPAPGDGPVAELLRRRILLVSGRLDPRLAEETAARALLADADGPDPLQLHVNCPDGDLAAAVMLAGTLQLLRCRVVAVAAGGVGGPAVAVYAVAAHRRAHRHAQFRLAEPRGSFSGPADQLPAAAAVHREQLEFVRGVVAAATGRDPGSVAADLAGGRLLSAPAAADYGLVHQVI